MMTQTLLTVALFVALLAMLPWAVRWIQRRAGGAMPGMAPTARQVGALAVGPQQRVVTVEVGPPNARTWLVLGVTAQNITCLHSMPAGSPDFAGALVQSAPATGPSTTAQGGA